MMSVPGPFKRYHEMRHNSAVTRQNQLEFWNQKSKQIFSHQSKNFGPWANIFGSRPFIVKSLTSLGLSMYKVSLDSDKYLLSYSILINPLKPDVHQMTSQILSILIDFYPDLCTIFLDHFSSLQTFITLERGKILRNCNRQCSWFFKDFQIRQ